MVAMDCRLDMVNLNISDPPMGSFVVVDYKDEIFSGEVKFNGGGDRKYIWVGFPLYLDTCKQVLWINTL